MPIDLSPEERRQLKVDFLQARDGVGVGAVRMAIEVGGEEGVFSGYLAHFNKYNQHNDLFVRGCFARAITERAGRLKVPWAHDDRVGCAVPLEVKEDAVGLWASAKIAGLDTEQGKRQWLLIKEGVFDGLSIEFNMLKSTFRWLGPAEYKAEELGNPDDWWFQPRLFSDVELLGWSPVMYPSDDDARVNEARSILRSLRRVQVQGWEQGGWEQGGQKNVGAGLAALAAELRGGQDSGESVETPTKALDLAALAAELRSGR